MNIKLDVKQLVADAVKLHVWESCPPAKVMDAARLMAIKSCQLVDATEAAKLLRCGKNTVHNLGLPIVKLSAKKHRYRLSDIEERINLMTQK